MGRSDDCGGSGEEAVGRGAGGVVGDGKGELSAEKGRIMTEYSIDKDRPIPSKSSRCDYPFKEMEIGDSFRFSLKEIKRVRNFSHRYYKSMLFTVHKTSEVSGRCWRIK